MNNQRCSPFPDFITSASLELMELASFLLFLMAIVSVWLRRQSG